jgi:hypothetical protein
MNALQVETDCRARLRQRAKAVKLRMISISASISGKYGAGQQRFSPQRDEAVGIEVPRMQRPEPHLRRLSVGIHRRRSPCEITCSASLIVGPHPQHANDPLLFEHLVYQAVLDIDSTGIRALEIAN